MRTKLYQYLFLLNYISLLLTLIGCSNSKRFYSFKKASIVIESQCLPSVRIAAEELSEYLNKIYGVNVPITYAPVKNSYPFFIGRSGFTDKMGIEINKENEEFKILVRNNFTAILGEDERFVPKEPHNTGFDDINQKINEWDYITKNNFELPMVLLFKNYNKEYDIWENENKGTLYGVYHYLEMLGVRWYMPGEIGTVIPRLKMLNFSETDYSNKASFPVRNFYIIYSKYFMASEDMFKWSLHLYPNNGSKIFGNAPIGHGMAFVHSRDEVKRKYQNIFAQYNGRRETEKYGAGLPCLSSVNLQELHLDFLNNYFKTYSEPCMSVMPSDGFGEICQCNLCNKKLDVTSPSSGSMSNYVWNYVDQLSQAIKQTHPEKHISCLAYATFLAPPNSIDKFNENVRVGICYPINGQRDEAELNKFSLLLDQWHKKLTYDSILIYDYFLYSDPKRNKNGIPVIFPKYIEKEIDLLKENNCLGKYIEVYNDEPATGSDNSCFAFDHLNLYLTSRKLWNSELKVDDILNEYYILFYGPAASEIKNTFLFIEDNWRESLNSIDFKDVIKKKLLYAQKRTKKGDIYYQRVGLLINFINNNSTN